MLSPLLVLSPTTRSKGEIPECGADRIFLDLLVIFARSQSQNQAISKSAMFILFHSHHHENPRSIVFNFEIADCVIS